MSYTNSSVSATLYGVDPGYEVTTVYGEWEEGEPYRTVVRKDPDYPIGTEFIESSGRLMGARLRLSARSKTVMAI